MYGTCNVISRDKRNYYYYYCYCCAKYLMEYRFYEWPKHVKFLGYTNVTQKFRIVAILLRMCVRARNTRAHTQ